MTGYYEEGETLGTGDIGQLTETEGWGDYALAEYEEELAKKKPLGFAPWPADAGADSSDEGEKAPQKSCTLQGLCGQDSGCTCPDAGVGS